MAKKPKAKTRKPAKQQTETTKKQKLKKKQALDRKLEEGLEETFPGSDPVAVTNPVREIKE
ncbi:MAG TPA: hypothetical protein VFC45_14150 [Pseudolabrys sp.]|nr:hypothetical protein [Pseudolabrys sp.]